MSTKRKEESGPDPARRKGSTRRKKTTDRTFTIKVKPFRPWPWDVGGGVFREEESRKETSLLDPDEALMWAHLKALGKKDLHVACREAVHEVSMVSPLPQEKGRKGLY